MDQFYYSTNIYDDFIILPEDEALHALKVLRKNIGDMIMVVDGKGGLYKTCIDSTNIQNCRLNILSIDQQFGRRNYFIHIGIYLRQKLAYIRQYLSRITSFALDSFAILFSFISAIYFWYPYYYYEIVTLSYLAAATDKIRLATGVSLLPYRDPVVLAKQAATLDQFSNGRFLFGQC